ncbi:MAG: SWIM zinc finger family protein [Anaerolineae bacterium]|nr:SWIM zinc finger family protein [Anaerolineae bacterium]
MSDLMPGWDTSRIASFAPDGAAVKAARRLALPEKWASLGSDRTTAWGTFQGSGRKPYQVMLDLRTVDADRFTYRCTCPSRKQPCKHVLALLLIAAEQPETLSVKEEPVSFVAAWLEKQVQTATQEPKAKRTPSTKQQEKSVAARMEKIAAGLGELEPWLLDVVRHGLGDARLKAIPFWTARAARLVDAQAPGLATRLRTLPIGAHHRANHHAWANRMLASLGQLYLIVHAFRQYDSLPAPLQADLRTALGWPTRQEELAGAPAVTDRWLVLGRREELAEERLRQQRLWLLGLETGRFALILEFAFGNAAFDTTLQPGETVEAGLVFYPSSAPLRAFAVGAGFKPARTEPNRTVGAGFKPAQATSVRNALQAYARALAANPWLIQVPFLLGPVWPQRVGDGWLVQDEAGEALPLLAPYYYQGWPLLALSGGQPLTLFGEWNGAALLPLTALADGRWVDLTKLEAH